MNSHLIVALDVPSMEEALALARRLPSAAAHVKVGLELFSAAGPDILRGLRELDKKIFLDLKLHDIPRTVERAVHAAARHGAFMMTLHAAGGRAMLSAAAGAARSLGPTRPLLVAVTVLTSLDQEDLVEIGIGRSPVEQVLGLTDLALDCGLDGVVCSVHEAAAIRARHGSKPVLVTPGIRPASGAHGDQKRVATPTAAVRAGSTFLVVGRPIAEASDIEAATRQIVAEMAGAVTGTE